MKLNNDTYSLNIEASLRRPNTVRVTAVRIRVDCPAEVLGHGFGDIRASRQSTHITATDVPRYRKRAQVTDCVLTGGKSSGCTEGNESLEMEASHGGLDSRERTE